MDKNQIMVRNVLHLAKEILSLIVYLALYGMLLYGILFSCRAGYQFCYEIFGSVTVEEAPGKDTAFRVETWNSMEEVAEQLQNQGLIVNKNSFIVRTKLMDPDKNVLNPGIYLLNTSMDYEDIINQLTISE